MDKQDFFEKCRTYWNPGKTDDWQRFGIDLVIGRREGYHIYDVNGRQLIDVHLNGGTYNLGHRNPELVETLRRGLDEYDVGNHHFPSVLRTRLAEKIAKATPGDLQYTVYASGGGEATDIAIKTARHATRRRKVVSIQRCYHGHTGLAVATGDHRFSKLFLSDGPADLFVQVPFNDLDAMERALAPGDAACVILETIPATYGFPMPKPGYLQAVREMCTRHGTLYIADEVQTGLGRTGRMWGVETYGVQPDILVTSKGLGGGLYPIGAVVIGAACAGWLSEDGFGHISTFGGAELGCLVAEKVLEITQREEVQRNVAALSSYLTGQLAAIRGRHGEFFAGVRQQGLVIGLEFDHPEGALHVMKALYDNGVWAIFSALDRRVLQFKPGVLMDFPTCDAILDRLDGAVATAKRALGAAAVN